MTPEQRLLILDTWQRSGLPAADFAAMIGISKHTLYGWQKRFEEHGPGGLVDQSRGRAGSRLPDITKRTILMLKKGNPEYGCQRISDLLARGPALPASPSAVARVLHEAGYQLEEAPTAPHPAPPRRFERAKPEAAGGSRVARRTAAAILEVLAGARTPTEAATALGISLVRYYLMEARGLTGLVAACEPRNDRRGCTIDREIARLTKELDRARRECARFQALARVSQRAIGLAPAPPRPEKAAAGKKRRRRKPTVRALKAAGVLQSAPEPTPSDTVEA